MELKYDAPTPDELALADLRNGFALYQTQAARFDRKGKNLPVISPALGLASEAGEVAGKVYKVLRDNGGDLNQETKLALVMELGDVLWNLSQLASDLGVPLGTVAVLNLDKLDQREANGTISGSGDDR